MDCPLLFCEVPEKAVVDAIYFINREHWQSFTHARSQAIHMQKSVKNRSVF